VQDWIHGLSPVLRASTTLTELNLERNDLGVRGAIHLSQCLVVNRSLEKIKLKCNAIVYNGMLAILRSLNHHPCIIKLFMECNSIEFNEENAVYAAECMGLNKSLKMIDFSHNSIKPGENAIKNSGFEVLQRKVHDDGWQQLQRGVFQRIVSKMYLLCACEEGSRCNYI
jgi:hypothetical protein